MPIRQPERNWQTGTKLIKGACALITIAGFAHPAMAQEFTPYIAGELLLELENDNVISATDPDNEINALYPTVELVAIVGLTPVFALNLGVILEQVLEPDSDNYFDDLGLYVDTVNIQADFLDATITAGKFAPTFGKAWDDTPGLFGTDIAEDYEVTEMIGFGVSYPFRTATAGTHTLSANAFFVDTTALSESAFTNRGRVRLSDGGPANTEQLDSFSITLDGEDIPALAGLSYNLGYAHLSAGNGDEADENGFVFGLKHTSQQDNGWESGLNGEIAYFNNAGGTQGNAVYFTAGLSFEKDAWHAELAGSVRQIDLSSGGNETTSLLQLSGGYVFANDVDLTLGYAYVNEDSDNAHVVGVQLSRAFGFATPGAPDEEFDIPQRPATRQAIPTIVQ